MTPPDLKETMKALSSMGMVLTLDDFGTGYSSLSYLKKYPINRIKIDQSFIHDITENKNSAKIVNAIILMCQGLKIKVIAEGVETKKQLSILKRNNCNEIQGYYFGRPTPFFEALALLKSNNGRIKPAEATIL